MVSNPTKRIDRDVAGMVSRLVSQWDTTSEEFAPPGRRYSAEEQRGFSTRVREVIDGERARAAHAASPMKRRQRMKSLVRSMIVESMSISHREETARMLGQFSDAGDLFVQRAREFDQDLRAEEIFQALRNLWIVNSLQAAFGLPVELTPSSLSYSLMYPYTDNYLDDAAVSRSEKEEFNTFIALRLGGGADRPPDERSRKFSELVGIIEAEYPRDGFPFVYKSLQAIHRAQQRSLLQHGAEEASSGEILRISVEKGGASVLADAAIVRGDLSQEEIDFSFSFGAFLQFIDDLQDLESDLRRGHRTVFGAAAAGGTLDGMTNRLLRFAARILGRGRVSSGEPSAPIAELMREGCYGLLLESIALNPSRYSSGYVRTMEAYSPLSFEQIREIHREMKKEQERIGGVVQERMFRRAIAVPERTEC